MKRFASATAVLAIVLSISLPLTAQPRTGSDPVSKIIRILRHVIGLDDPSFPKP